MGVDRFAAWSTARGIAEAAELSSGTVEDVEVEIHGFPFLTQLVAGSLDEVTGAVGRVSLRGYEVRDLRFEARAVASRAPWEAGQVGAEGVVAFDTLAAALTERVGVPVTVEAAPGGGGGLEVGLSFPVRGVTVDVRAVVEPLLVDGVVAAQVTAVSMGGTGVPVDTLPAGLGEQLSGRLLPFELPDGARFTGVSVEQGGLRLAVEAQGVALGDLSR